MACPYTEKSPAARGADCPQCVEENSDPIRPVFSRGWCRPHYDRWKNHGDVRTWTQFISRDGLCQVCLEDGEKEPSPIQAKGMCGRHYQAKRKFGDPRGSKETRNQGRDCSVEECGNSAFLKGYCEKPHYFNYKRTGDPLLVAEKKRPGKKPRDREPCSACVLEGEVNPPSVPQGGLCNKHVHRRSRERVRI